MKKRGAILSWCFYDWAMSAYNTVIGTFIFSVYFTRGVAESEVIGTAQWGRAVAVSGIAVAVLSPVLGAIADRSGRRKPWLALFTGADRGGDGGAVVRQAGAGLCTAVSGADRPDQRDVRTGERLLQRDAAGAGAAGLSPGGFPAGAGGLGISAAWAVWCCRCSGWCRRKIRCSA